MIKAISGIKNQLGNTKRGINGFIKNYIEQIPPTPKDILKLKIGQSLSGRPINCYRIGRGKIKLLFVSGIHGNEVGTVKLAHYLINLAYQNKAKLEEFSLFVIPCLNLDGYVLALKNPDYFRGGRIGRFNSNNVDLNRNFDTPSFQSESIWSFGKNYKENIRVFCGEKGNSEPEILALTNFIINNQIKVFYSFHSAGRDVMGNRNELAQKITKIYCQKTGFRYIDDDEWKRLKQTGTPKEWCELNNIAYIEIEGSNRWGSDWKREKEAIISTIFECLKYEP